MTNRQLFLQHLAQTSGSPLALEIVKAEGMYMWDAGGKKYLDLIAGISVCNLGHRPPAVVEAVEQQLKKYLHLLVYGELVQTPQVRYAQLLTGHLPLKLNCVYFTNSGAEAVEGAMKLAKRFTGRTEIAAFRNSYHGSTQGALSVLGDERWRNAYRPLLPGIRHLEYNSWEALDLISSGTAAVIAETVQAEAGVIVPRKEWLQELRKRCTEQGALLILDEIQCGFGRNGTLWAFEQFETVPDILLLGKALGAGMPMGAFIARKEVMNTLAGNPVLGHITTFGGHPVCCAAGLAGMEALLKGDYLAGIASKEQLFRNLLTHKKIKEVRSLGLMMAIEFDADETCKKVIDTCIDKGVLTDWFLFAPQCMRIVPPLIITEEEIAFACRVITDSISAVCGSV